MSMFYQRKIEREIERLKEGMERRTERKNKVIKVKRTRFKINVRV